MKKKRGFTLVEIMVVIAIVMILASAAVLQSSQVQNLLQFNNTFSKLTLMVQRARNLASTETEAGTDFGVYMEGTELVTSQQKVTLFADRDGDKIYDSVEGDDEKLENALIIPENIKVNGIRFGINSQPQTKCIRQMLIIFQNGSGNPIFDCDGVEVDRSVIDPSINKSGQMQVELIQKATSRQKCFVIHVLSGIPQIQACEKI